LGGTFLETIIQPQVVLVLAITLLRYSNFFIIVTQLSLLTKNVDYLEKHKVQRRCDSY